MTTQNQDAQDRQTIAEMAAELAYRFSGDRIGPGDLARVRRMNLDSPNEAVFWDFIARKNQFGPVRENNWALVMQGIALMTGTSDGRSAHDGDMPIGRALFYAGDDSRTSAFYSESRLNRLLVARGPMLRTLLGRMFRMMASANQPFNWREMARLILNDGRNEAWAQERAERVRRNIARAYYHAKDEAERKKNA